MRLLSVVYPGHRPRSATAIAASWGKDLCAPRYISASGAMETSELPLLSRFCCSIIIRKIRRNVISLKKAASGQRNRDALVKGKESITAAFLSIDRAMRDCSNGLPIKVETEAAA
jgi:hypothetical protein